MRKNRLNKNHNEIQRIQLLMGYDTQKTLNENVEELTEAPIDMPNWVRKPLEYGAGAAGAFAPIPVPGGPLVKGILGATLGRWLARKDTGKAENVRLLFNYCTSSRDDFAKLEKKLSPDEIGALMDQLYESMQGMGTDEEAIYGVFNQLSTAQDFCALSDAFRMRYGDLYEWLDDDFDNPNEWEKIYEPIRLAVENTLNEVKDKTDVPGGVPEPPKGGGGSSYHNCTDFPFTKGCRNAAIKEMQKCLGLELKYQTGNFGPITEKALTDQGYNVSGGITKEIYDAVIAKCAGDTSKGESIYTNVLNNTLKYGTIKGVGPVFFMAQSNALNPADLESLSTFITSKGFKRVTDQSLADYATGKGSILWAKDDAIQKFQTAKNSGRVSAYEPGGSIAKVAPKTAQVTATNPAPAQKLATKPGTQTISEMRLTPLAPK